MPRVEGRTNRFPKARRLLDSTEFQHVFASADFKVSNRHFLILARRNSQGFARLGLIVAKKHSKRAVDRNRLKRLIRESFRTQNADLADLDSIVLTRGGAEKLSKDLIAKQLVRLWGDLAVKQANSQTKA